MACGRPSLIPKTAAFPNPNGVHDGLDLGRSIIQRANTRDRVRQPDPGLIEYDDATKGRELIEESLEFGLGPEQLHVGGERPGDDQLDGTLAEHLIREAEITAGCVRGFRHAIKRIDAWRYDFGLCAVLAATADTAP